MNGPANGCMSFICQRHCCENWSSKADVVQWIDDKWESINEKFRLPVECSAKYKCKSSSRWLGPKFYHCLYLVMEKSTIASRIKMESMVERVIKSWLKELYMSGLDRMTMLKMLPINPMIPENLVCPSNYLGKKESTLPVPVSKTPSIQKLHVVNFSSTSSFQTPHSMEDVSFSSPIFLAAAEWKLCNTTNKSKDTSKTSPIRL